MNPDLVGALRGQVVTIMSGTIFVFIGVAACGMAAIRHRQGDRVFVWLGTWSALYGTRGLLQTPRVVELLPDWLRVTVPFTPMVLSYLLVVAGSLVFVEQTRGAVKRVIEFVAIGGMGIAVAAVILFVVTRGDDLLTAYNSAAAVCTLSIVIVIFASPKLARQYLLLYDRGVLLTGTLIFSLEALYANVSAPFGFEHPTWLDDLGFASLLLALGYAGLRLVLANERRLIEVENELAVAREIQTAILPAAVPKLPALNVSATYRPMTAVAGDFYDFLPVDEHRAGFLVADVCGHGVPAALIASMVKAGVHTVASEAHDPSAVMRGLNRVLSSQSSGQLVSAAYLWIDTERGNADYAAAGHPPLFLWRDGTLRRIESNGMLFGFMPDNCEYPVFDFQFLPGDRFLLCTDGALEPENAAGIPFADTRFEEVIREEALASPAELSERLLAEISRWQPDSVSQQDDITLLVIDAMTVPASQPREFPAAAAGMLSSASPRTRAARPAPVR